MATVAADPPTLEQRLRALESGQMRLAEMMVGVLDAAHSLNGAVFALGLWMQTQTERLPGEQDPPLESAATRN